MKKKYHLFSAKKSDEYDGAKARFFSVYHLKGHVFSSCPKMAKRLKQKTEMDNKEGLSCGEVILWRNNFFASLFYTTVKMSGVD